MLRRALAALLLAVSLPACGTIVFQDDFEYAVGRTDSDKATPFTAAGWSSVKSNPAQTGACGYIYTTTSITGFSGSFPGTSSSRVLAMEFLPYSLDCQVETNWWQSDLYLQIGGESASQSTIPPNMWLQYWMYINNSGTQQTTWDSHGTKWLYPCIDGAPTCSGNNVSYLYLLKPYSYNSYLQTSTGANIYAVVEGVGAVYTPGDPEPCGDCLGHNVASGTGLLSANQWILVKIRIDISGSQGIYQEWHRTVGGSFVQVADWRGGVTSNFTWPLSGMNSNRTTGQKSMKFGTTWNNTDGWIYVDDFVMATTEGDLPTYGNLLPAPGNPRWRPAWSDWPTFAWLKLH